MGGVLFLINGLDLDVCYTVFIISMIFSVCEYLFTIIKTFNQEVQDMTLISIMLLPIFKNVNQFVSDKIKAVLLLFLPGLFIQQLAIILSGNYHLYLVYVGIAIVIIPITLLIIFAVLTFKKYAIIIIIIFLAMLGFSGCLGILIIFLGLILSFYLYHLVLARLKKVAAES
jgi:hypothetical protein